MKLPWFALARVLTIAAIIFLIAELLLDIWFYPRYASENAADWTPNVTWSPEATRAALAQLGWEQIQLANLFYALSILIVSVLNCVFGLFILWRKRDAFGLFVAFVFVFTGTHGFTLDSVDKAIPIFRQVNDILGGLSWQLGFILYYVFPNGHFVPRWTRWLLLGWLGLNIVGNFSEQANPLQIVASVPLALSPIASLVYRYFKHSSTIERQQIKWVVYGWMAFVWLLPLALGQFLLPDIFVKNGGAGLVGAIVVRILLMLGGNFVPVALAVGILRYRLWDIDVIIRKTITYSILTALLLGVYFGMVVVTQQLLRAVTGQNSELAIIISTLAIALLFGPLRRRIQDFLDRRFYRRKYDAQQVLAQFAKTARDETDIDKLTNELVRVVDETMQPERVELWLKKTGDRKRRTDK